MNKFIKKYQIFWEPKIGDRVQIIKIVDFLGNEFNNNNSWYYNVGDYGKIIKIEETTSNILYYILFDKSNKTYITYKNELKLVDHVQ